MSSIRRFLLLALVVPVVLAVPSTAGAATITVNSTADDVDAVDGECTFREAIASANADVISGAAVGECAAGSPAPTRDLIRFAIPGTGVQTIALTAALPALTAPFHVDGYTQTGAAKNTETAFGVTNAQLTVEINGAGIGAEVAALVIEAGASGTNDTPSILEGLVINRVNNAGACCQDHAIVVEPNVHDLLIRGNFVGVQADGTPAVGTGNGGYGVFLRLDTAPPGIENRIVVGGFNPADRNILSSSSLGAVSVSAGRGITIRGNLIGTDRTGTLPAGTAAGITLRNGATQTTITENLISANTLGIHLRGANGNSVTMNRIGTRADGTALGNGQGVLIEDVGGTTTTNTFVGNVVAFSTNAGITVRRNSTDVHGNLFVQNRVHDNGGLGIDLGDDGVTPNDGAPDADTGANGLQNFPVLSSATASGTQIEVDWILTSAPNLLHQVEFFHSPTCDPSGHGEGMTYLGQSSGNTNGSGVLTSIAMLTSAETTGYVTAIASVLSGTQANSTSEFSACVALGGSAPPPSAGTLQLASDTFGGMEGVLVSIGVTRTGGSAGAAGATCQLFAGTADGADYSLVVGNVSWLDGETDPKECTVQLQTDGVAEGAETFTVVLADATGATLDSPVEATVTIQDAAVAPAEIPTLGQWSLLLLALGLGLLGLRRLRLA